METTDYCSYELSKALKAAGFDEPCNYGYSVKMRLEPEVFFGEPKMVHSKVPKNYNDNRKGIEKGLSFCSAPLLYHAQKWLRDKKDWHIIVRPCIWESLTYEFMLWHRFRGYENADKGFYFSSYEQALSEGIKSAIELIKKGG